MSLYLFPADQMIESGGGRVGGGGGGGGEGVSGHPTALATSSCLLSGTL